MFLCVDFVCFIIYGCEGYLLLYYLEVYLRLLYIVIMVGERYALQETLYFVGEDIVHQNKRTLFSILAKSFLT